MKGNVSGYVCNHGSPSGERDTASPRLWAMLRTQASDEEADYVFSRRLFIMVAPVVTSWAVAGQQLVFLHMYLLTAFPIATPRGRSVSFPTRGTMVTYVTWDVSSDITAVQDYEMHYMNAWLKRCVFDLDLNRERVFLNPERYQEGYSRVWEPIMKKLHLL